MYQEFPPPASLRETVECFWISKGPATDFYRPVFPDGGTDIIFNFGHPPEVLREGKTTPNEAPAFAVGNMTKPIFSRTLGVQDLLGIRFRPGGMSSFVSIPLWQLTDLSVPLPYVCKTFVSWSELAGLSDAERISRLTIHLLRETNHLQGKEWWRQSLCEVVSAPDNARVYRLAHASRISEKQLERKFNEKVGITPKQLMQVLRFRKLQQALCQRPHESLLSFAVDHGFTDHAHLTRFFKAFAEMTPSEFRANQR